MSQRISRSGRRSFLAGIGGVAGFSVFRRATAASRPQRTVDDDWTQFGADAANTARLADGVGPTGTMTTAWETAVGYGTDGITIIDETVSLGGSGGLVALNAADGTERWTCSPDIPDRDYPDGVHADVEYPAVMAGTVYATVRFGVFDGDNTYTTALIEIDATTGAEYWRTAYPSSAEYPSLSVDTADTNTVYIDVGSVDADVIALDRADGSERWRSTITQPEGQPGRIPTNGMARVGEFLYVGGAVIDPTDGTIRWTGTLSDPWIIERSLITVTGGRSYFSGLWTTTVLS